MATPLKLPYGLRGQQLLHIGEVANGLACDCVCPGCGARLVARNNGKLKIAHFAHHQAPECATGLQTALHLAAKDVFLQHRTFRLPGAAGIIGFHADNFEAEPYFAGFDFEAGGYQHAVEHELDLDCEYNFPPRSVAIRQVLLEHRTADIIPDIILETEAGLLLVEVAVTHFIDEVKLDKIKRLGLSTIEIDLSKCGRDLAGDKLADLLIYQTEHKRWVHNAPLDAKVAALHARYLDRARPLFAAHHAEILQEHERVELARAKNAARRDFYATRYKPITVRPDPRPPHEVQHHVLSCPDPRRAFEGQTYANVPTDCFRCAHFRGYDGVYRDKVVCLFEYNKWEKFGKPRS